VTEPRPSMDAEDLKVKSSYWEFELTGARYKLALSTIFSKMKFVVRRQRQEPHIFLAEYTNFLLQ